MLWVVSFWQIKGFPTILFFPAGNNSKEPPVSILSSPYTHQSWKQWIVLWNEIQNHVPLRSLKVSQLLHLHHTDSLIPKTFADEKRIWGCSCQWTRIGQLKLLLSSSRRMLPFLLQYPRFLKWNRKSLLTLEWKLKQIKTLRMSYRRFLLLVGLLH